MFAISNFELYVLIVSSTIANGLLALPQIAVDIGGPGGWILVLAFGVYSLIQALLIVLVYRKFPNINFIALNQKILGRPLGSIIGISFAVYYTLVAGLVARGVTNIAITTTYEETPLIVLVIIIVAISGYAVYHGLKVLAYTNIILLVIKLLGFALLFFLVIPDIQLSNLLPLWERGEGNWLDGILHIFFSYSGFIILAFLYPHLKTTSKTISYVTLAILTITVIYIVITALAIATLGCNNVTRLLWPTYTLIKIAEYPIDAPFMAIWITNAFSVIASELFMVLYALKKLFKLNCYKHLLPPLGIIVICIAVIPKGVIESGILSRQVSMIGLLLEWLLPTILLAVTLIKTKGQKEQAS